MLNCVLIGKGWFIFLTILWVLSEALGETKLVKSNGVLSFVFEVLGHVIKIFKRMLK